MQTCRFGMIALVSAVDSPLDIASAHEMIIISTNFVGGSRRIDD